MNSYFNQFAGCRNSAVAIEPVAPDDAAILDLRRAVPILTSQFLDLECTHMPTFDGDSAGETDDGSDADSHSIFLDDAPTGLTADDLAVVADFVAKALPRTAGKLCLLTASPATIAARKRRRIVITSSSSSSPPHHLHASPSVITSAAVLTDANAAVAAPALKLLDHVDVLMVQNLLTATPATIAARKRRRIVITSSTSSSPPHHLHASASVNTSAAVLTDADAAVAAPA
jgi:hypothetical protein